jgi:hypothetical protein
MRMFTDDEVPNEAVCRYCGKCFDPESCLDMYCDECIDATVSVQPRSWGDGNERSACQH